jgi:hypothetical protein
MPTTDQAPRSVTVPLPHMSLEHRRFLKGIVLALVSIAFALGVIGVGVNILNANSNIDTLQHQVHRLSAQLTTARASLTSVNAKLASVATSSNLGALQTSVSTLQTSVSGLNRTVSGLQGDSAQLKICIPEVQQQISGLSVNSNSGSIPLNDGTTDSFLTSAFLQNPTVISSNCTKLLEPNSTTNG